MAFEQGSCCGGPFRWSGATDRSRFAACCGYEAERLEIAEPPCECLLDQTRRQRRCLAPTTRPDQCEGLWLRLGGEQDQQGAADLDQVQPAQQDRPASLPHRAHAIGELEGGEQRLDGPAVRVGFDDLDGRHITRSGSRVAAGRRRRPASSSPGGAAAGCGAGKRHWF